MGYYDPKDVLTPKSSVAKLRPIYDSQEDGFSVALMDWDEEPAVGIRWNGSSPEGQSLGNPQSRGLPTWFILPRIFAVPVLKAILEEGVGGGNIDVRKAEQEVKKAIAERGGFREVIDDTDLEKRIVDIIRRLKDEGEP